VGILLSAAGADWFLKRRSADAAYFAYEVAEEELENELVTWTKPAEASRRWCQVECKVPFAGYVEACRTHLEHTVKHEQRLEGICTHEDVRVTEQRFAQATAYRREAETWLAKAQRSPRWKSLTLGD